VASPHTYLLLSQRNYAILLLVSKMATL